MKSKLIDIHTHMDLCKDVEGLIARAKEKDVLVVGAGVDHKSNATLLNLSKDYENLEACFGLYPTEAEKLNEKELEKELIFIKENRKNIVGISEVGLDLHEGEDLDKQKFALRKLALLAKSLEKPIIVHSRKVEEETIEFLEGLEIKKVVMHCFSASMKLVKRIVDNGWSLSIPAIVKYSEHFQHVVENTPIEQLFCETDSPFLHPEKERDNESSNVIESYKKIAEIKETSLEKVKDKIWENYERLFLE